MKVIWMATWQFKDPFQDEATGNVFAGVVSQLSMWFFHHNIARL